MSWYQQLAALIMPSRLMAFLLVSSQGQAAKNIKIRKMWKLKSYKGKTELLSQKTQELKRGYTEKGAGHSKNVIVCLRPH